MTTKNTLKSLLASIVAVGFISNSEAQTHVCGMDHYHEEWRKDNPNFDELETAHEPVYTGRRTQFRIPVVFHVLHSNGPENISESRILDQMKILNEDFSKQNPDAGNVRNSLHAPFLPLVANMEIEFVLAKRDPEGRCTNGINKIYSNIHSQARNNVKEIVQWDPKRYLNIWVVSSIESSASEGTVLGFANFPWMPQRTDGVVIIAGEVGYVGAGRGRTLTHEVGHYLGLLHPFQGGCTYPNDRVDDTPLAEAQFTNTSCPPTGNSCALDANKNPLDTLYDQWENFMDYSFGCQVMFTEGQKERALYFLTSPEHIRHKLYSAENLAFTGVTPNTSPEPLAHFTSNKRIVCAGEPVQFFNNSCQGAAAQRTWEFQGADISSSTDASPTVTYAQPGKYAVKLSVSNNAGTSEYEVTEYITVQPTATEFTGLHESFEESVNNQFIPSTIAQVRNVGYDLFEVTNVGYTGNKSLKAPIHPFNAGARFTIETPTLNISNMSDVDPKISFMVAYARRNTDNSDYVRIYVSEDCGNTWQQRYQRNSAQINSYGSGFALGFTPAEQSDWIRVEYPLTLYRNSSNVKIRIEVESGGGNPIYIDDINISQYYTSVTTLEKPVDAVIFPNPSNGIFTIQAASVQANSNTKISLTDLSGKEIGILHNGKIQGQNIEVSVNPKDYNLSSGIYFVKIETASGVLTKKLILTH